MTPELVLIGRGRAKGCPSGAWLELESNNILDQTWEGGMMSQVGGVSWVRALTR